MLEVREFQDAVDRAVQNAIENGYEDKILGEAETVALDMFDYDADVQRLVVEHQFSLDELKQAIENARKKVYCG